MVMHANLTPKESIPLGAAIAIAFRGQFVFFNTSLKPLGLSAAQFPVLMLLAKEQNITQDTLVRHYHLDKGTIARTVKKLESSGFIWRTVDPGNRRAVRLFLTKKGERAIPLLQEVNRTWEGAICSGLSSHEQETLHTLLYRAAKNSHREILNTGGAPCDRE